MDSKTVWLQTQGVEINEHSAFTPDITPIILAAHKDNYECIKLFLDKKATIPHPHDVRCCCKECLQVDTPTFCSTLIFVPENIFYVNSFVQRGHFVTNKFHHRHRFTFFPEL